jgi:hypothetical protein
MSPSVQMFIIFPWFVPITLYHIGYHSAIRHVLSLHMTCVCSPALLCLVIVPHITLTLTQCAHCVIESISDIFAPLVTPHDQEMFTASREIKYPSQAYTALRITPPSHCRFHSMKCGSAKSTGTSFNFICRLIVNSAGCE